MKKSFLQSDKGLTLVEVLAGLTIFSVVAGMIISNLISGMNSFESVTKQVSLQDEANYIMTQFVNQIYVAKNVVDDPAFNDIIVLTNFDSSTTTLGFKDKKAIMNGSALHTDEFQIDDTKSEITIDPASSTVSIKMIIKDNSSGKSLELNNKVSFVKVD